MINIKKKEYKRVGKYIKLEKGITLIALIITVIILVILSAVSIASVYKSRIIEYSINGTANYINKGIDENIIIEKTVSVIDSVIEELEKNKTEQSSNPESKPESFETFEIDKQDVNGNCVVLVMKRLNSEAENKIEDYEYYIGDTYVGTTKDDKIVIEGLETLTDYKIKVIAKAKDGKEILTKEINITTNNKIILYNKDLEASTVGGAWNVSTFGEPQNGTFSKNEEYMQISGKYCYAGNFTVAIQNTLDFTKYNFVKAKIEVVGLTTTLHGSRNAHMVLTTKTGVSDYTYAATIRDIRVPGAGDDLEKGVEEIEIDLSALTEKEMILTFNSNSYDIKVYEVWVE